MFCCTSRVQLCAAQYGLVGRHPLKYGFEKSDVNCSEGAGVDGKRSGTVLLSGGASGMKNESHVVEFRCILCKTVTSSCGMTTRRAKRKKLNSTMSVFGSMDRHELILYEKGSAELNQFERRGDLEHVVKFLVNFGKRKRPGKLLTHM